LWACHTDLLVSQGDSEKRHCWFSMRHDAPPELTAFGRNGRASASSKRLRAMTWAAGAVT
jgi:hypothetical protein